MKPWKRQHLAEETHHTHAAAAHTAAAQPAAAATAETAAAPAPKTRTINLPTVGRLVYVYGLEHTPDPLPLIVSKVDAVNATISGSAIRSNGQQTGETHVVFPDQGETAPAIYAAWMPYQLKAETTTPAAQAAAQAAAKPAGTV